MAVRFRGFATTASSSSPFAATMPGGIQAGMCLTLHVSHMNDVAITVPGDWTLVDEIAGAFGCRVYTKIAGASEPGTIDISRSGSGSVRASIVAVFSDRGRQLTIDAFAKQSNASSTDRVWPGVTTMHANGHLLCFGTMGGNVGTTPDAAMIEEYDAGSSLTVRTYMMRQALGAAGATGTRTGTGTAAISNCVTVAVGETDDLYVAGRFVTTLEDTNVRNTTADTNRGTEVTIATNHASLTAGHFNGLLRPRFLDEFPAGAILTSATLHLHNLTVSDTFDFDFELNAILSANAAWTDITATWNFVDGATQRWAGDAFSNGGADAGGEVAGTDYNATPLGILSISAGTPTHTEQVIPLNAGQIVAWLAGGNHGIILRRTDSNNFNLAFHSAEATNAWLRPRLVMEFVYPAVAYSVADGHDVPLGELVPLSPQPSMAGVYVTRRDHGSNASLQDDARYLPLFYGAFESVAQYHSVLTQFGVKDQLENDITVTARDRDQVWKRWNGTVVQPQLGQDGGWSDAFLKGIVFIVKDIREAVG